MTVLVTGSSGFVGSCLVPSLEQCYVVLGIDRRPSESTSMVSELSEVCFDDSDVSGPIKVIHLAAARFDYGAAASKYKEENIDATRCFLNALDAFKIETFIHVSSVAAIDGAKIKYSKGLNCDDAYRATKFLQEQMIREWATRREIPLYILYPSAIFDHGQRWDTNIGKLQFVTRYIPFLPEIPSAKSLTFLPAFSEFILACVDARVSPGGYVTIERPVLSVTEILGALSYRSLPRLPIPGLRFLLTMLSGFLWVMGGFGRIDYGLTPNRVKKLFSDTNYTSLPESLDAELYNFQADSCFELLKKASGQRS